MHWQGCRYDGGPRSALKVGRTKERRVTNLFVRYGASCTIFYEEWYITWTNRSPWRARAKDELGDGEIIRNMRKRDKRAELGHGGAQGTENWRWAALYITHIHKWWTDLTSNKLRSGSPVTSILGLLYFWSWTTTQPNSEIRFLLRPLTTLDTHPTISLSSLFWNRGSPTILIRINMKFWMTRMTFPTGRWSSLRNHE